MGKMKSADKLSSFIEYCLKHPDERFWQALRNWSQYQFIYVSNQCDVIEKVDDLQDTFYIE